jgi:hypothetical protein
MASNSNSQEEILSNKTMVVLAVDSAKSTSHL